AAGERADADRALRLPHAPRRAVGPEGRLRVRTRRGAARPVRVRRVRAPSAGGGAVKLAISNIAWPPEQDGAIAPIVAASGADAVELAPTAYHPDPLAVPLARFEEIGAEWRARGLPVVSLQALLFGRPDLHLFDPATRAETMARLVGVF